MHVNNFMGMGQIAMLNILRLVLLVLFGLMIQFVKVMKMVYNIVKLNGELIIVQSSQVALKL